MTLENDKPEPADAEQIETFGGDYHRLESTFRPVEKTPRAPQVREKGRTRDKNARKPRKPPD